MLRLLYKGQMLAELIWDKGAYLLIAIGLFLVLGTASRMDMNVELMVPDSPSTYCLFFIGLIVAMVGGVLVIAKNGGMDEDY